MRATSGIERTFLMRARVSIACVALLAVLGAGRMSARPDADYAAPAANTTRFVQYALNQTGCGTRIVAVVVDPALAAAIRAGLDQFEQDLCASGYNTVEHTSGFKDAAALRSYLSDLYSQSGRNLAGAILIGDLPRAYQWVTLTSTNPNIPSTSEEVISFQYYADLDGTFAKSAAYISPGGRQYSYDLHYGNIEWEIWIGVIPLYKGDLQQTTDALNRYFAKNHAYRTGQLTRPPVFLEVNELHSATTLSEHQSLLDGMRSGPYSWTPYSNSPDARLYFNSPPGGLSVQQGYTDLQNGVADFMVQDAHGYWGAGGQLTIAAVESTPVRTLFFWSSGCAIGDLDHAQNFLTSVLYSSTSEVLVAKGTTNNSGGMGNNSNGFYGHNVALALTSGASFGDALLSHVNVPLISPWSGSREFEFATAVILGDPSLRHRFDPSAPALSVTTTSLPHGTVDAVYTATLQAANGTAPYTWSISIGTLPAGLALDSATGAIAGTSRASGNADFTVRVEDANRAAAIRPLSIVVHTPLALTTTSLPAATQNAAYSSTLAASGGNPPFTWSIIAGALPAGLRLNSTTGVIAGTPASSGTSNFTLLVADAYAQTDSKQLGIDVNASDFSLSSDRTSATVTAGSSATFNLTITPVGAYNTAVALSCTSPLPQGVSCSFTPASVTPAGGPVASSLRVTTTGSSLAMLWLSFSGVAGCVLVAGARRRRPKWIVRGVLLVIAMVALAGCGGGSSSAPNQTLQTPKGTMTITVLATSGSLTKTLALTITVQ